MIGSNDCEKKVESLLYFLFWSGKQSVIINGGGGGGGGVINVFAGIIDWEIVTSEADGVGREIVVLLKEENVFWFWFNGVKGNVIGILVILVGGENVVFIYI